MNMNKFTKIFIFDSDSLPYYILNEIFWTCTLMRFDKENIQLNIL